MLPTNLPLNGLPRLMGSIVSRSSIALLILDLIVGGKVRKSLSRTFSE
nr:hypothetical protein [Wolbachia endosymbiont (group A) of Icerya purchasi]